MRFMFILSTFALTMIMALLAFTYTAIHYPSTMRDLLAGAQRLRDQISLLGLSDSYMVWVDIFLQANQIVLVGFSIAMRIVIGIIGSIFSLRNFTGRSVTVVDEREAKLPFNKWG